LEGHGNVETKRSETKRWLPRPCITTPYPTLPKPQQQQGLAGISVLALGGADVPAIMSAVGSSAVGPLAKVVFAFPLVYHYGSGLRHFVSLAQWWCVVIGKD
jgi:hypothetical protein